VSEHQVYEFDMPSNLCGLFIGRGGMAIKQLRFKTGIDVIVRPKQFTEEFQLVVLEGTQRQVTRALDIIRQKFPKKRFPELDLSPAQPEVPVLQPQVVQVPVCYSLSKGAVAQRVCFVHS
jgi:A-kinase anchor protein 1